MNLNSNWDDEDRKNRLEITNFQHKEKKAKKKEKRKTLLKEAINGLIHQIKITILIILIVSLGIIFLCTAAWYILKIEDEKESTILPTSFNAKTIIFNYDVLT